MIWVGLLLWTIVAINIALAIDWPRPTPWSLRIVLLPAYVIALLVRFFSKL